MTPIPLTPEEGELLHILEGRRPQDLESFQASLLYSWSVIGMRSLPI